jgi:uncharacterized membrane protein
MENQQSPEAPKKSNKALIWIIIAIIVLISLCGLCGIVGAGVYLLRSNITRDDVEGQFCGGIANIQCPAAMFVALQLCILMLVVRV